MRKFELLVLAQGTSQAGREAGKDVFTIGIGDLWRLSMAARCRTISLQALSRRR